MEKDTLELCACANSCRIKRVWLIIKWLIMQILVKVIVFLLLSTSLSYGQDNLSVKVTEKDGSFQIYMSDTLWFSSGGVLVHSNGKWYNSSDASLVLSNVSQNTMQTSWGTMNMTTFKWTNSDGFNFTTYVKVYQNMSAAVFGQHWDVGGTNTATTDLGSISLWPTFKPENLLNTGYMTYSGNFAAFVKIGAFNKSSSVYSNIDGGFPLTVFDNKMENTLIISPLDTFMSASLSTISPTSTIFGLGIVGNVTSVPNGYTMETIVYGGRNITGTMAEWGSVLRTLYKKDDQYRLADKSINYLGYYTDNGACYYYSTGEYSSYEDAILAVKKSADYHDIPYNYLQLDSWWYYRGNVDGVKNWTALPNVFPNGIHSVSDATKWSIVAHNRFWSNNTDYAKQNGGSFDFYVDPNGFAVPIEEGFWEFLLTTAKYEWNLMVYEQDWLDVEYQHVKELQSILNLGGQWLDQMGSAALKHDLTIQYCMPWTRHILQSLNNSAVTQIRVSDDYQPGNGQWQVGDTTILAHSLGLAAFKDTFRTLVTESNCKFPQPEPNPALETYVAALTAGPVGPSDNATSFNKTLILATCMKDGLLLKPTRPAMSLDATFVYRAFGSGGPKGDITVAYTEVCVFIEYSYIQYNAYIAYYSLMYDQSWLIYVE